MPKQATFTEMMNGTAEDYAIIGQQTSEYATQLPDRILEHLSILKGDTGGFAVDRFTHCLQTCLLYTSPSPRDLSTSRMPSSA